MKVIPGFLDSRFHLFLLFMPRGEHFCLTLRCQTGAQLRLSILRKRFEPGERVARSIGKWTKC